MPITQTYEYTGASQTVDVSAYDTAWAELRGAAGEDGEDGDDGGDGGPGGPGGLLALEIDVSDLDTLELYPAGRPWGYYDGGLGGEGASFAGDGGDGAGATAIVGDGTLLAIVDGGGAGGGGGHIAANWVYGGGGGGGGRGGDGGSGGDEDDEYTTGDDGEDADGTGFGGDGGDSGLGGDNGDPGDAGGVEVLDSRVTVHDSEDGGSPVDEGEIEITEAIAPRASWVPTIDDLSVVDATTVDLEWTYDDSDLDGNEDVEIWIRYPTTDGDEFRDDYELVKTLSANTTSHTLEGVNNGREFEIVVAVNADGSIAPSDPESGTTPLPDVEGFVLDGSEPEELAVEEITPTLNHGEWRLEWRRSIETEWDDETTVPYDADPLEHVIESVLDGEQYDVRVRSETVDATGAWHTADEITALFSASDLEAIDVDETSATFSWIDESVFDGSYQVWLGRTDYDYGDDVGRIVTTVADDAEEAANADLHPEREYAVMVRAVTQYVHADSEVVTFETDSIGLEQRSVPSIGWHVEIDHPSGRTLKPQILDEVEWIPVVNGLPRVEIPVPRDEKWRSEALEDAPMRVWKDGVELPIDELRGVSREPGHSVLEGVGGTALDDYYRDVEYVEEDAHVAAEEFIENVVGYTANVDEPDSDTRGDVLMQDAETESEMEDALAEWPFGDTDPLELSVLGEVEMLQSAWFTEAEDADGDGSINIDEEGRWSGGEAVQLGGNDERTFSFSPEYEIPSVTCEFVFAIPGDSPGIEIEYEGTTLEDIDPGILSGTDDQYDLRTFQVSVDDVGPDNNLQFQITNTGGGDDIYLDWAHIRDDRFSYSTSDTEPEDGVVEGWEQYPESYDVLFDPVSSIEQVVGARAEIDIDDTSGDQALAVRNSSQHDWVEATNTDVLEVAEFAEAGQSIQLRVTLSRYDSDGTESGTFGDVSQVLDAIEVLATLQDIPVLLDFSADEDGVSILNRKADAGDFVWEVRPDGEGGTVVEWTQPGQRESDRQPDLIDWEAERTTESAYQHIIVEGDSRNVEGELFSVTGYGFLTGLDETYIRRNSERVYDPDDPDEVFERNVDYEMVWQEGAIRLLEGGSMDDDAEYAIDYRYKIRGEYEIPGVDDPATRKVNIADATTEREAELLAFGLALELQEPLEEATAVIDDADPRWSLVEALSDEELPFDVPVRVREIDQEAGQASLRLGSRRSVREAVDELRTRIDAVAGQL
ncbi:fibronectin type III domain-containing protein [Natrarchaeobius oligotrophus]|uniref:Fibronectin type III domain-containing protein n=1 Tax=Natrarchaeobius chitinivorans TaxID=1679083 RepID=A0A3N6N5X5_NATCH|nr:fibronectin type III domain-containing protein [Natrarchaeobius chitinivorans]RQG93722.1 fibronectin type III domain-containing protein [Natrarchaeobius chitinivorans]